MLDTPVRRSFSRIREERQVGVIPKVFWLLFSYQSDAHFLSLVTPSLHTYIHMVARQCRCHLRVPEWISGEPSDIR
jgi:hypothetical protein